jgi:hypothetical protein
VVLLNGQSEVYATGYGGGYGEPAEEPRFKAAGGEEGVPDLQMFSDAGIGDVGCSYGPSARISASWGRTLW